MLCSGSQRHKSYDRFGKLVRAAAQKAVAGEASGGDSRAAPSFAETSRHLRQCLERKAKDSAFYGAVLAAYLPDGAALIGRQELVAPSSGVYCCFCSHQTAYTWCMDAKRDFKRRRGEAAEASGPLRACCCAWLSEAADPRQHARAAAWWCASACRKPAALSAQSAAR